MASGTGSWGLLWMRNLATDEEKATNTESECTLGVPGRAEGADSSNLQQKSSCQDSHTRPVPMGRVVGLEKSGKGSNEGESRQRLLGVSLLAGGIREGVVGKSRRWCSSESCVFFIPYSSHTSPPCLNWRKSGNIMTYRQRERWAKSKCTLKCSLYPLCLVLGFWEKSPYGRGEWEERTYCTLEIEFFVWYWAQKFSAWSNIYNHFIFVVWHFCETKDFCFFSHFTFIWPFFLFDFLSLFLFS